MAAGGDGMKPHESPYNEQKSNVEQLPVKKPIVLSSASSEDDPIEQLSSHNIEMHSGKIPIYSKASKSLTSKEILQLCFGEVKDEYICKQKPISDIRGTRRYY
jgi:hypothetical protein